MLPGTYFGHEPDRLRLVVSSGPPTPGLGCVCRWGGWGGLVYVCLCGGGGGDGGGGAGRASGARTPRMGSILAW